MGAPHKQPLSRVLEVALASKAASEELLALIAEANDDFGPAIEAAQDAADAAQADATQALADAGAAQGDATQALADASDAMARAEAVITNFNLLLAKLDLDGGVTDEDYESTLAVPAP